MLAKIKRGLQKRKVKLFFVFLLCSFLAWFVSNLSETYTSGATFGLHFTGIPEDKLLMGTSKEHLDVKLEAVGFQFLGFAFRNKEVDIDVSEIATSGGRYYVAPQHYRRQVDKQLSNSMKLVQIDEDTLFIEFDALAVKEVPVRPDVDLNLDQNHVLEGEIKVSPPFITLTGPSSEVANISALTTPRIEFTAISSDFSRTSPINLPDSLLKTTFSHKQVVVSGTVAKFSEKIISVPIHVLNVPTTMRIQTFPERIELLCKASVRHLKTIKSSDFRVVADYEQVSESNQGKTKLMLTVQEKPERVFDVTLLRNEVDYILSNQ